MYLNPVTYLMTILNKEDFIMLYRVVTNIKNIKKTNLHFHNFIIFMIAWLGHLLFFLGFFFNFSFSL